LYGLKQAGKLWFENIKGVLLDAACEQCAEDECVFRLTVADNNIDIDMALHVDDLLTSGINR
jgi:hypothetical protein